MAHRTSLTPLDVARDASLLGPVIGRLSWGLWLVVAALIFGLAHGLTPEEQAAASTLIGGRPLPKAPVQEAWLIVGRRGGKSLFAAFVAVYLACFRTYRLGPGEKGVGMVLAADRRQAGVVKRYISGLLHACPMLEALIVHETKERIELRNRVVLEVHSASFRAVRGYTVLFAICDELAFWPNDDSANPDSEVLTALRPAMATTGGLLLCISSPYARRGELYRTYQRAYGKDDPHVLVVKAPTRTMNPTVPQSVVDQAMADDDAAASAEYGAEFRRDVEALLTREVVQAATVPGRRELPPLGHVHYTAFIDPSGGSADSMTLAVAHRQGDHAILDTVREVKPPFSPSAVVTEFAALLRQFRVHEVWGDRYAGEWPREQCERAGITYRVSDKTKSDLYRDLLPLLNSARAELLDVPRLQTQLVGLERRTARGGRDSIDHAPGSHDDVANAVAGALVMATDGVGTVRVVSLRVAAAA